MYRLIGAVPYPANWQQSTLPKGLSAEEVEQLVHSFGQSGRGRRRADAIVRCALDLGLRAGEIARLQLDDIDWQAGTITLRRTKGRRHDVMPLPAATGEAIAAYLQRERPKTSQRTVFVRRVPPCDLPLTRDSVSHVIKYAYARAGLALHPLPSAAPHDGQPNSGGRWLPQGSRRCPTTPFAQYHARLRQA